MRTSLEIIVPCFNEELNLPQLFTDFELLSSKLRDRYDINLLIIDNGCQDKTVEITKLYIEKNPACGLISLSRNFGKEASLTAGIIESRADLVVPIDADQQDPIVAISKLLEAWEQTSADVILGRRIARNGESQFRKITSKIFMWFFHNLSDIQIPKDVGEFRLMTKKVVEAFRTLPESERFVRGIMAWLGFKTVCIDFERDPRKHGKSKFSLFTLGNLAVNAITSFSTKPLRISMALGIFVSGISLVLSAFIFMNRIFNDVKVPGYSSLAFLILFLGGLQLFSIGVVGEYLGKVMLESKRRPVYLISETYNRRIEK